MCVSDIICGPERPSSTVHVPMSGKAIIGALAELGWLATECGRASDGDVVSNVCGVCVAS